MGVRLGNFNERIEKTRQEIALELRRTSDEWRENGTPQTLDGVVYPLFKAFHVMDLTPYDAFELIAYYLDPACEAVDRDVEA